MINQALMLWNGKSEIAGIFFSYKCIGFGNSNESSTANQSPLLGDDLVFKPAETSYDEYDDSISVTWASPLIYGDLWNATIGEIAIVRNCTSGRNTGLLRLALDPPILINKSDTFKFYITVRI